MDLRNPLLDGVRWLERMALPHLIISGIILVIHPTLYSASQTLHQAMQVHGDCRPYIGAWNVPFNAVNVITNRGAPAHYDASSSPYVPDLLISLGGDRSTNIRLQELGAELRYTGGTFCAFSGSHIKHAVAVCPAERVCYAYYPRYGCYALYNIEPPSYQVYDTLLAELASCT